jgi:ArsR family transcriptional regulator
MMESQDAVSALSALAQEHRLEVFRLLVQAGAGGMPPSQIVEQLKIAAPTLSFHLAQLIYTVNYDAMNELMAFLTDNCCSGDTSACRVPVCDPESSTIVRRRPRRASRQ